MRRALNKAITSDDRFPPKDLLELRAELFGKLGIAHWQRHEQARIRHHFPPGYPLL